MNETQSPIESVWATGKRSIDNKQKLSEELMVLSATAWCHCHSNCRLGVDKLATSNESNQELDRSSQIIQTNMLITKTVANLEIGI